MSSRSAVVRTRAVGLVAPLVFACGGGSGDSVTDPTDPGPGTLVFRASLIDTARIQMITPLGNINTTGHSLPTDHIYFRVANPDAGQTPAERRTSFFAPADGIVRDVIPHPPLPDVKVVVRATTTVVYYIDHLIPEVPLARGTRITAGLRLGLTGSVFDVDLGVVNDGITLTGFVNPARYGEAVHADAPLKYYAEPLRSLLYAKVQRIGAERDGKIDYDVPGRLSGAWFTTDSIPLVFAYNTYDPADVIIAVPPGLPRSGLYAIATTDPLPRDVSVASGLVRYTLAASHMGPGARTGSTVARMLVQLLDERSIRSELFAATESAAAFTSAARVFVR